MVKSLYDDALAEQELLGDLLTVEQVRRVDGAGNGHPRHHRAGAENGQHHGGADGRAPGYGGRGEAPGGDAP